MPAVTVDDLSRLPKVPAPERAGDERTAGEIRDHGAGRPRRGGVPGAPGLRRLESG